MGAQALQESAARCSWNLSVMYRLLTILLWPVWLMITLRTALREHDWRYLKQRLGYAYPQQKKSPLWIHCASVGEVNTWLPLQQLLARQYPELQFVITTTTVTGAGTVARQSLQNTQHIYFPIDTGTVVARFLRAVQPRMVLIMETELWPELYRQCRHHLIPVVIVNARLSHKTLRANAWIKNLYQHALQGVSQLLCRSQADVAAYTALGADPDKTLFLGNLKFAALHQSVSPALAFSHRPYVLAASTHDDEEWQIAQLWKTLHITNQLLVIAPRHPQRRAAILKQLAALQMVVAVRSRGDQVNDATQVYLADTLGELTALMVSAEIVIMGGSLVPHGGQNLLEPARFGKAIIVGPHMHNFAAELALFLENNACLQVANTQALAVALQSCLQDARQCTELGTHAQQLMQQQSDVALRYLAQLNAHYAALLSL